MLCLIGSTENIWLLMTLHRRLIKQFCKLNKFPMSFSNSRFFFISRANIVFSSMLPMTTGPKRTPKSILKKSKKNLFEPLETDVPDPKRTKLEIPLLECSNSADIPDNDLVNLSDSRNDNVNLEDLPDGGFGPCNELNVRTEVTLRQT